MLVQAKCPGCRTVLRIPSEWVNKSVRCKECGIVVRAEKKSARPRTLRKSGEAPQPIAGAGAHMFFLVASMRGDHIHPSLETPPRGGHKASRVLD